MLSEEDKKMIDRLVTIGFTAEELASAIERHDTDRYTVKAPPVCTVYWNRESWIRYIASQYRNRK